MGKNIITVVIEGFFFVLFATVITIVTMGFTHEMWHLQGAENVDRVCFLGFDRTQEESLWKTYGGWVMLEDTGSISFPYSSELYAYIISGIVSLTMLILFIHLHSSPFHFKPSCH